MTSQLQRNFFTSASCGAPHVPAVEHPALLRAARERLLLLRLAHLRRLVLDLTGTSQRAVDLAHDATATPHAGAKRKR